MVTKEMLKNALIDLGVEKGMVLEVHSSLSSFGELDGIAGGAYEVRVPFKWGNWRRRPQIHSLWRK